MQIKNMPSLKIHSMSQEQFEREKAAGNIEGDALYLTPDETVMTVTIDGDKASHTAAEIYAHVQSGGTAVLNSDTGATATLSVVREDVAFFEFNSVEEGLLESTCIYEDGSIEMYSFGCQRSGRTIPIPNYAKVGQTIVVKSVDANGTPTAWEVADLPSGSSTLVVSVYQDGRVSHTSAEIYAHVQNGGSVILVYDERYYMLLRSTPDTVWFGYISDDRFVYCITFYGAGDIEEYEHEIPNYPTIEKMIDAKLGTTFDDIDTLLGGDS